MITTLKNYLQKITSCFKSETGNVPQQNNPVEHSKKDLMIRFIEEHNNEMPVFISAKELCKSGRISQEKRTTYLKRKEIGSSQLREVLKSPQYCFNGKTEKKNKDASYFQLGNFIHMAFIEPELFSAVKIAPDFNLAIKKDVIRMIQYYRELNGKDAGIVDENLKMAELKKILNKEKNNCPHNVIKENHYDIIRELMKNSSSYGHRIIAKILKGAVSGLSFYHSDEKTGIQVKARPDFINFSENIGLNTIISLRTTHCEDLEEFYRHAAKLKYELSEGMHQEIVSKVTGRDFNTTIIIMMQTVAPYNVAVLWLSPQDLQAGKDKYHTALQILKDCTDPQHISGNGTKGAKTARGIISMQLP